MPISFTYSIQNTSCVLLFTHNLTEYETKIKRKTRKKNKNNKKCIMKARETERKKKQRLNKCARRETGR